MNINRFLIVFALGSLFLLSACGGGAPAEPAPVVEQQPVEPAPTEPAPPTPAPVEPATPEPTQPQYADFCQAAPTGCEPPEVEIKERALCVKHIPYAIISAPPGTIYEPLDDELKCIDQVHADGNLRITCHSKKGRQLWTFDLKLTNGACTAPALQMDTDQCPDGYGYDTANLCCAQPSSEGSDAGSIIFPVDIGSCG